MKGYAAADIARLSGAIMEGDGARAGMVQHLLTDSRKLSFPSTSLFFAIKTKQGDGHHYIAELYKQGVRHFVVSDTKLPQDCPDAIWYHTDNVIACLQRLAAAHRQKFGIPVLGITGSNGKTIVKEWLNALLQDEVNIVRSPRSFNSQLGVPLSVWAMQDEHELGIFEAGISRKGEMQLLEKIIRPTIGLITNLGAAHSEGFDGDADKLTEKLLLFQSVAVLVYCKDHRLVDEALQRSREAFPNRALLSWGKSPEADIRLLNVKVENNTSVLEVDASGRFFTFSIPYVDAAALENAMHCFAAAVALGYPDQAALRMMQLPPLSMRLEMKEGRQGCTLINDSYNADLSGIFTALDFLGLQDPTRRRTVVLSDVSGLPDQDENAYDRLVDYLVSKQVRRVFGAGQQISAQAQRFASQLEAHFFPDTQTLIQHLAHVPFKDEVILIKGARDFHFEAISTMLESKMHQTRLEVNLPCIAHNLQEYRKLLPPDTRLMVMVKAFSYGAGSIEVARLLQFHHADYIAVAYVDEGVELRKAGIRLPIMVMNTEPQAFALLVENDLEPELYSLDIIRRFHDFLRTEGIAFYPVHIKLDTGMHRLGLDHSDIIQFNKEFGLSPRLRVKSVFTHLVASEDSAEDAFTARQLADFEAGCGLLQQALGYVFWRHAANTAAISRHPQAAYEMVRLGIGLYGVDAGKSGLFLQEAISLKTTIAQIRDVEVGESVGYGRKALLHRHTRVATIRVGYADGFPRSLGNGRCSVLIKGRHYPTLGNVCMDMTMIDITGSEDIGLEDEVLVFGPGHSISQMARAAETIPYEIMTGIAQRVPRIYFSE